MTTARQQLRLQARRTTQQIERTKRIFLLVALAGILLFMFTACSTQPQQRTTRTLLLPAKRTQQD